MLTRDEYKAIVSRSVYTDNFTRKEMDDRVVILYDHDSEQRARITELEQELAAAEEVIEAKGDLLLSYRVGKQPKKKTLKVLDKYKQRMEATDD